MKRKMKTPRLVDFSGSNLRVCYPTLFIVALLLVCSRGLSAASWDTELENGQQIRVDPTTNRPLIESGAGQGRPLWDGVHRLRDGSTITIRSGVMVPNEELEASSHIGPADVAKDEAADASTDSPTVLEDYCDTLVLKTCGLRNSCEQSEPCQLSRQLRAMQRQPSGHSEDNLTWAEKRCHEALDDDERFTACDQEPSLLTAGCEELLEYVCGTARRCFESGSCVVARDLFSQEQAAVDSHATEEITNIRHSCQKLLSEHAFFPPCR